MRPQSLFVSVLLATLLSPAAAWGQRAGTTTRLGDIRGQLRLPDGKMAPYGIPVVLMYREGDMVAQGQTDSSGKFAFVQILPGIYKVKVHAQGFLDLESAELDLNLSPNYNLSLVLQPDPKYKNPFVNAAPGGVISAEQLNAPEEAKKALASGEELLQKGTDFPKSIEFFQKAVKAYPKYSEAYLMMGVAYRAQSKYDEAEAALRKCIEINANSASAYAALGEVQNEKKNYAEAERILLKAVALSPESPQAHQELARTYWAQGRWQEADPHAAKALLLEPNSPTAHLIMGNIELRKRDGPGALQQFQEYLRLAPQGPLAPNVRDLVSKLEKALAHDQKP